MWHILRPYGMLLGLLLFTSTTEAQPARSFALKPALLRSQGAFTGAVRFSGAISDDFYAEPAAGTYPTGWFYTVSTEGAVALKERLNPDNLTAKVGGGWSISLKRTPQPPPFDPNDPEPPPPPRTKDWGRFDLSGEVEVEADQSFDAINLTGGGEASYVNIKDEGLWFLVPSVVIGFDVVQPVASALRDTLGEANDPFTRVEGAASWKFRIGERLGHAALRPLGLHVDVRFFNSFSLPDAVEAYEEATAIYAALDVSYALTGVVPYVREVFVRLSDGRLPPSTHEASAVYIGVVVGESQ